MRSTRNCGTREPIFTKGSGPCKAMREPEAKSNSPGVKRSSESTRNWAVLSWCARACRVCSPNWRGLLRWRCTRAKRSRPKTSKKLTDNVRGHWDGITAFMQTRVASGVIEATNGLLQRASA